MTGHYEQPHPKADACERAGVGKACQPCCEQSDYSWKFKAQAWDKDPYYVASSAPIKNVTVVASTEDEARAEAERMLPPLRNGYYYRFWLIKAKDVRLLKKQEAALREVREIADRFSGDDVQGPGAQIRHALRHLDATGETP